MTDWELNFTCNVVITDTVQFLIGDDGSGGVLINDADSVCIGEVCLTRADMEQLRDWLNHHLS